MTLKNSLKDEFRRVVENISTHTIPFSVETRAELANILIKRELGKGELFLKEGDISNSLCVVTQGIVRQFYYKKNIEITEHFTYEGHMFVCLESFIQQTPTTLFVESIEPTTLFEVPHDAMFELAEHNIEILKMYCKILESSLLISQQKAKNKNKHSAKEKYLHLCNTQPEIIKRVPLVYIASYLDISPETLSRIRAEI